MKCMKVVKNKKMKWCWNKKIILFCLFTVSVFPLLQAQKDGAYTRFQNQFTVNLAVIIPAGNFILDKYNRLTPFSPVRTPRQWSSVRVPSPDRSPRVYNYHEIGIFCKLDVKLDKVSKLPVRFRLGTQEVVDRKEGKY